MGSAKCPSVDREEIVNACGVDDFHDGANVVRTACVIGMAKAREAFEPFLQQLGARLAHVQRRMLPISMYLMQRDGAQHALRAGSFSATLQVCGLLYARLLQDLLNCRLQHAHVSRSARS